MRYVDGLEALVGDKVLVDDGERTDWLRRSLTTIGSSRKLGESTSRG